MITVDGQQLPWREGMTVADLLEKVDSGDYCAVVRLNGKLVSSPAFHNTSIPDNSVIQLLPLVAGG